MMNAFLVSLVTVAGPSFESDSNCPSAADVEAAVAQLLPSEEGAMPLAASIETTGPELRIVLRRETGEALGTRTFVVGTACDQRVTVAAVVIASWQRELRAQLRERQSLANTSPAPAPSRPTVDERGWNVGTSISALTAGNDGGGLAPAASLTASLDLGPSPAAFHFGLAGGLAVTGERAVDIGTGRGLYRRASFALGPRVRRAWAGSVWLEPRLALEAGMLDVRGEGFPMSFSGRGWELAGLAGGRFGVGHHGLRPFLAVDLRRFITRSDLVVPDLGLGRTLPSWEAQLGIGICYLAGP